MLREINNEKGEQKMKKIFTLFIGNFVCMANIGFAMDVIDIP